MGEMTLFLAYQGDNLCNLSKPQYRRQGRRTATQRVAQMAQFSRSDAPAWAGSSAPKPGLTRRNEVSRSPHDTVRGKSAVPDHASLARTGSVRWRWPPL